MFTAKDDTVSNLKNVQNYRNSTGAIVEETKDDIREVANKAGRKVRKLVHTASDEFAHAKDTVTTEIRSNPVRSSFVALGLGVVLGALLRR